MRWARDLAPYGLAVVAPTLAAAVTAVLWAGHHSLVFPFYLSAILVSAAFGHARAALVAIGISALTAAYLFFPPQNSFAFGPEGFYQLCLFVGVASLLVLLGQRIRVRERRLRESQSRLANAQRIARMGSWHWNLQTRDLRWSDQLFEVLEISKAVPPDHETFLQRVHPEDRQRVRDEIHAGLASAAEIECDYRLLLPNGTVKVIHSRGDITRDEDGKALRFDGTTLDLTRQWRAQEALRLSEERFRALVGVTAAVFWWTDAAGHVTEATPSWTDFTGKPPEEMTQPDGWFTAVHPDDRARAAEVWRRAVESGSAYCDEYRLRRKDGVWRDMISRGTVIRNLNGSVREWIGTCVDVTELEAAEQSVRFQAQVLDTTREAIIATDPAGKIIYMNRFAGTQFGVNTEEVMGADIMSVTMPNTSREQAEEIIETLSRGQTWSGEFTAGRRDGSTFPIRASNTPLCNEAGDLIAIVGVARDMSEYHESQQALRQSEERYRAAFEQAPVGICEMSFEGTFSRANPRLCRLFGYSRDELLKAKFSDITHPDDLPRSLQLVGDLSAGQRESFAIDKRYVRQDGRVIWAMSTVSLLRDREGKPQSLIAVVEDISARKEAEEKLRFQAHILESAGEAIIATDAEGVTIYVNREAELLYGWREEEAIGRSIIDLLLPSEIAERVKAQNVMAALRAGQHARSEYFLRRRDGSSVRVSVSISVVRDPLGAVQAIVGISRDVTEINRAREALVQSEGRLRALTARLESSREEERTRIARAIHDELGQLLTGLKMDLRWVEDWLEKTDDVRLHPFLDRIVGSTELTDAMIKAVQGIAADLRPGVLDNLGLASALDFEARRFQERTGTVCAVDHPEEMSPLSADVTTSLFRIFQECLTNVARHSAATRVDVLLTVEGDAVALRVSDNGRGMRDIDRVAVESLGLLGISERVKLLGGKVSFSSAEEHGTSVHVYLPQRSQVEYRAA